MRLKLLALGATTALTIGMATQVLAGTQDFTFVNNTGVTIDKLYVDPSDEDSWSEDVLGKDVLADGEETHITFDGWDPDHCAWDLYIIDNEGHEWEVSGDIDLCKTETVTVTKKGDTLYYKTE